MGILGRRKKRFQAAPMATAASWYVAGLALTLLFLAPGCATFIPDVSHYPQVQNPFPELSRVAVAPFFNQSDDATVDGRRFALAYYAELQETPGFEVVPVGVVEEIMMAEGLSLRNPQEAQRLAQMLGVDAVVVGSITDYSPYYPPRCGLRVEWYAADTDYGPIRAGYGLPWGTPEEEYIPPALVYEAEMDAARARLTAGGEVGEPVTPIDSRDKMIEPEGESQSPVSGETLPVPPRNSDLETDRVKTAPASGSGAAKPKPSTGDGPTAIEPPSQQKSSDFLPGAWMPSSARDGKLVATQFVSPRQKNDKTTASGITATTARHRLAALPGKGAAFTPAAKGEEGEVGPVMAHTQIYHGHDRDFTEALQTYVHFRDDQRFGEWQTYLQRSEDFIRFCCHLHLSEMLTARGGGTKTRVVSEWVNDR